MNRSPDRDGRCPLTLGFGRQQAPLDERLEFGGVGGGELVKRDMAFGRSALLVDGHQAQQGRNDPIARRPGRVARLLQRGIGLALKSALHTADLVVSLVGQLALAPHPGGELFQRERQQRQGVAAAGVGEELIRISVGLETLDDILWDIDNALSIASKA